MIKPGRWARFLICLMLGSFAPRRDLLLSTVTKVGKSTGRNLRFLHLRARYVLCRFAAAYHTFTEDFLFRFDKRIVSAPVPLPLMPTPNNAVASTVDTISGSGARRTDDASYAAISNNFRKRVVKDRKFAMQNSVRGSLNRRFKLSFWVLLGQRPKVPRPRGDEIPLRPEGRSFQNTKDGSPRPLLFRIYRTMLRSISARECAPHISMVSASSAFSFSTSPDTRWGATQFTPIIFRWG